MYILCIIVYKENIKNKNKIIYLASDLSIEFTFKVYTTFNYAYHILGSMGCIQMGNMSFRYSIHQMSDIQTTFERFHHQFPNFL